MFALFLAYIMWRSNFTILHSFGAYNLDIRLYFGHPPIFWKSAVRRASEKEDLNVRKFLRRAESAGPVSPTCFDV